jgi:gluconolactonase
MEPVVTGLSFPEGPAFDADGNLYVVELAGGRVVQVRPDGSASRLATMGGGPNGLAVGPEGELWVANSGGLEWGEVAESPGFVRYARVEQVHRDGSVSEPFLRADGRPLLGPNDVVADARGDVWFTDPGGPNRDIASPRGRVCWADPNSGACRVVAEGYRYPNGLALRNDDRDLIVAETGSGLLWVHPVLGPAALGPRRPFARMPPDHLPDGMCFDASGRLLVAGVGGSAVVVFGPDGEQVDRIPFPDAPDGFVTNLAFEPGQPVLYVTIGRVGGSVVRLPWDDLGTPLPGWNVRLQ